MSYDMPALTPLLTAGSFTVWQYRTMDSRAAVTAPGYFSDAKTKLQPGHLLILQSADAMTFQSVSAPGVVGLDLTVDTKPFSLNIARSVSLQFGPGGKVAALLRELILDAMPNSLKIGSTLTVAATAKGPFREARFTLLNSSGTVVSGPVTASVVSGRRRLY